MSSGLNVLLGAESPRYKPLPPFDARVTGFLAALSSVLLADPQAKRYPDIVTFAFFCRRANLEALRAGYGDELAERVGRGLVFHVAPGNVPVNFAYSLVSALLAGCASVVKASSRGFDQVRILCDAMRGLLAGAHAAVAPYVNVVTYPREEQQLTERFSAICDARVIWGGDATVRRVREAALPPRAFDIPFPDRYSLFCADAAHILTLDEKALAKAALGFYNDTYLSDQNACTSPRLVYWLGAGEAVGAARARFWATVRGYAAPRYAMPPVVAVDKLTMACRMGIDLEGARVQPESDNLLTRVLLEALPPNVDEYRAAGGFFAEYAAETLDALIPAVKRGYQTLVYLGLDPAALRSFVRENGLWGVDRIAPVGHSMDFSLVWDGTDLIRSLSRRIAAF